jgi:hypothetical protein
MVSRARSLCLSRRRRLRCWRILRRSLSANAFVVPLLAARVSFCVVLVIAGSVIAVLLAARKRGRNNGVQPASVINAAAPDASIIGIANALIVAVSQCGDTPH